MIREKLSTFLISQDLVDELSFISTLHYVRVDEESEEMPKEWPEEEEVSEKEEAEEEEENVE